MVFVMMQRMVEAVESTRLRRQLEVLDEKRVQMHVPYIIQTSTGVFCSTGFVLYSIEGKKAGFYNSMRLD